MDVGQVIKNHSGKDLKYIHDAIAGITRKRLGEGFVYFDPNGVKISNENILQRINELTIPPAWEKVWISPFAHGHIQATGFDARGRKQYIYHEVWKDIQKQNKFDKVIFFGRSLPKIRRRIRKDINARGLDKHKVIATVVWLLEHTFIRVGNDEYAKENKSFGLTTLRNRHVTVKGSSLKFEFAGKSGVKHLVDIHHPKIAKIIKRCIELPGYELFQCLDENLNKHAIDSADVNEYLQAVTGEDISAKDFRTWGGSFLSAVTLRKLGNPDNEVKILENISNTIKEVSRHLRNTPAVCRNYYIHPTILQSYEKKVLVKHFENLKIGNPHKELTNAEFGLIKLLEKYTFV